MKLKLQPEDDVFSFTSHPTVREDYLKLRGQWLSQGFTNRDNQDQRFGQTLLNNTKYVVFPTLYYKESFKGCCELIDYLLFGVDLKN